MTDGRAYLITRKILSYYTQKKIAWEGDIRLYERIGPVGRFDENHITSKQRAGGKKCDSSLQLFSETFKSVGCNFGPFPGEGKNTQCS